MPIFVRTAKMAAPSEAAKYAASFDRNACADASPAITPQMSATALNSSILSD
jgi:hypothetical protein